MVAILLPKSMKRSADIYEAYIHVVCFRLQQNSTRSRPTCGCVMCLTIYRTKWSVGLTICGWRRNHLMRNALSDVCLTSWRQKLPFMFIWTRWNASRFSRTLRLASSASWCFDSGPCCSHQETTYAEKVRPTAQTLIEQQQQQDLVERSYEKNMLLNDFARLLAIDEFIITVLSKVAYVIDRSMRPFGE